jgi:hypothetical protein
MAEFRYPVNNIRLGDDYFKIRVIEYVPPGLNLTGGFAQRTTEQALNSSVQKTLATVYLPMPANIQDNNSADWATGTMNPLTSYLGSAGLSAVESGNVLGSIAGSVGQFFTDVGAAAQSGSGQKGLAGATAAAAVQAALGQGDINSIISRATGQVFNQNVELLFNGVTIRPAFSFTFDMTPRSEFESKVIRDIIRTFKKNMTPRKGTTDTNGGGLFVKAPNIFRLEYMSGGSTHPFLHKFKPCALTQMSVNYNGSAQYATYPDATPVHMQMTLQFQELSPIYAEDYDQTLEGTIGVGY